MTPGGDEPLSPDDGGSCHLWLGRGVPPAVNRRR
nr:head-tail joining protein [Escherichia coli]